MIRHDEALELMRSANPIPGMDSIDADELDRSRSHAEHRRFAMTTNAHDRRDVAPPAGHRWRPVLITASALALVVALVGAGTILFGGDGAPVGSGPTPTPPATAPSVTSPPEPGVVQPDETVVEPRDLVLAGACALFSDDDIDDIVHSAYEAEGLGRDAPSSFERWAMGVEGWCDWSARRAIGAIHLHIRDAVGLDDDDGWCPRIVESSFERHPGLPRDVAVSDVGVHRFWASDWRLHATLKVDGARGFVCFDYLTNGPTEDQVESIGLRVAAAMIDRIAHATGDADAGGTTTGSAAPAAVPVRITGMWPGPSREDPGEYGGDPIEGSGESWSTRSGVVYRATIADVSDDRVAGHLEHTMDIELVEDDDRYVGYITANQVVITNEAGTWEGSGAGTTSWSAGDSRHLHVIDYELVGTGGYEGLRYVYRIEGYEYPWTLTGSIERID